jgi:tetratricopeptide (TPR) repeat protein
LFQKAVASDEKNFGEDHPSTAISYNNLASVLQDLGEYAQAKTLLQKAVASDEKNFGEDHPTTAIHYNNLAIVLTRFRRLCPSKNLATKKQ